MKKLLSVSVASLALASVASYTPVSIGVTEITPAGRNTIVPAPYKSLSDGGNIAVKDLVKSENLPDGTMLYYYNGATFDAWVKGTGTWTGSDIAKKDGVTVSRGADSVKLAVGSALWVVLTGTPAENQKIYVYGAPSATATSTVASGATALVANPCQSPATPSFTNAAIGDTITFVSDSATAAYSYDGAKWGAWTQTKGNFPEFSEWTPSSLAVGQGFWYKSKGVTNVTINWQQ